PRLSTAIRGFIVVVVMTWAILRPDRVVERSIVAYALQVAQTRWLSPAEQRTWRAYLRAAQHLQAQLDRELERDAGMPFAYFQILVMLSEVPERSLRMSDLAERTWSSRSRLSHAIDRLEERGWVERVNSASDRRGAVARLTNAGFDVLS